MSYQYTYMGKVDVVFGLVHKSMFLTKLRSWSMNFTIMHSTLLHNPCNMFFLCIFRNDHINCTTYHMLKIFQHSLTYYSNWLCVMKMKVPHCPVTIPLVEGLAILWSHHTIPNCLWYLGYKGYKWHDAFLHVEGLPTASQMSYLSMCGIVGHINASMLLCWSCLVRWPLNFWKDSCRCQCA